MLVKSYMLHQLTRTLVSLDAAHFPRASLSQNGGKNNYFCHPTVIILLTHPLVSSPHTELTIVFFVWDTNSERCTKDFRANVGSTVWTGSGGSSLRDLWTRRNNQGRFCWSSLLFPVVQPTWENSVTWPSSLFVYDNLFQLFPVNSTFIICRNNSFCEEDARQVLARLETKLTG